MTVGSFLFSAGSCALIFAGLCLTGAADAGSAFQLTSPAFAAGGPIPDRHTCAGANVSPTLQWSEPPRGTKSLALIVEDPGAQAVVGYTWVHWTLFDLPAEARSLSEGFPQGGAMPGSARFGKTHFGKTGYGGPCPPKGPAHRYYFTLYALDTQLDLRAGATADELTTAMKGHVLGQAELIGTYARK